MLLVFDVKVGLKVHLVQGVELTAGAARVAVDSP
tara:strand:+ start:511 stop:612 length:102 start_codon:yes stop_codon:yes gene_type:complete